jgi:hypothetical protein
MVLNNINSEGFPSLSGRGAPVRPRPSHADVMRPGSVTHTGVCGHFPEVVAIKYNWLIGFNSKFLHFLFLLPNFSCCVYWPMRVSCQHTTTQTLCKRDYTEQQHKIDEWPVHGGQLPEHHTKKTCKSSNFSNFPVNRRTCQTVGMNEKWPGRDVRPFGQ